MGYILPIQQHEYADYQKRMVTKKRTIASVEKPYKVILKSRYEEVQEEAELRNQKINSMSDQSIDTLSHYMDTEELYAEFTGIGIFINERV
ncbi:hypothetical protein [Ornithinibacillus californiensis]|uniref:hypothetical protein n=1 Tax=Ornithinibacillus californiensis TaxID=161536 RepID=UPI00064D865F|nr:hypothetical protein [Ornithinibacillus californiensis]